MHNKDAGNGFVEANNADAPKTFMEQIAANMRRYRIKRGHVVYFGGVPVQLEVDAIVLTATHLVADDPGCAEFIEPLDHYI